METTPILLDTNRKGQTRGEAIFGDKHKQFEVQPAETVDTSVTSEGQSQLEYVESRMDAPATTARLGDLAATRTIALTELANQYGDNIDQERLDRIAARLSRR